MKTVLAFVRKDSRALWWAIALCQGLWAALVWMDSQRRSSMPGMAEGWGHIVVPLAWVILLGLTVLEDSPTQRRQFWRTTPCLARTLLAAKALFALCWVHVPYLIGCSVILWARGFAPWEYVPHLLWKQALVLVAVTIPAMAAAALVTSVAEFLVLGLAAMGLLPYIMSNLVTLQRSPFEEELTETAVLMLLLTLGSALVLLLVYELNRAQAARLFGAATVAGVVVAAAAWSLADSVRLEDLLRTEPLPRIQIRAPSKPDLTSLPAEWKSASWQKPGRVDVLLPAEVIGFQQEEINQDFDLLKGTIVGERGESVEVSRAPRYTKQEKAGAWGDVVGLPAPQLSFAILLSLPESEFRRVRLGKVSVEGSVRVSSNSLAERRLMREDTRTWIPELGFCSVSLCTPFRGSGAALERSVTCESTKPLSPFSEVRYWKTEPGWSRTKHLVDYAASLQGPARTWLSPLYRVESRQGASMHAEGESRDWTVEFKPSIHERSELVRFRAEGLYLSRYALGVPPEE
ncbi:MAG: hypothetical protein HY821_12595 [Acidobacteria bacterium]|nr:hypothetical protein [Acidobacteriota bacterium]